jgi:hypothetical protein
MQEIEWVQKLINNLSMKRGDKEKTSTEASTSFSSKSFKTFIKTSSNLHKLTKVFAHQRAQKLRKLSQKLSMKP